MNTPTNFVGPDGGPIVEGSKFRAPNVIYGKNLPPHLIPEGMDSGNYLIEKGIELELLMCERPIGYAPFRWPAFDGVGKIGVIWVDVNELEYVSGNFGDSTS